MYVVIILIIIVMVGYLVYKYWIESGDVVEGLNTFNGRMAIDDQYFYDSLFDQVYYYPNNESDGTTGWDKCKSECQGNCQSYGYTNISYCFNY